VATAEETPKFTQPRGQSTPKVAPSYIRSEAAKVKVGLSRATSGNLSAEYEGDERRSGEHSNPTDFKVTETRKRKIGKKSGSRSKEMRPQ